MKPYLQMFRNILSFIIMILWSNIFVAQTNHSEKCGHSMLMESYEKQYPGFKIAVEKTFEEIRFLKVREESRNDVYKVNVVFHIVWKEEHENLHDSVILNQLEILNKDYRLLNDNRNELRSIFKSRQADAGIEFRLKEIKRVKTNSNFALSLSGLPDNVKRSTSGGSDAVSPEKVMNIWICHIRPIPFIGGQILGYAYPPAGLNNWPAGSNAPSPGLDGVVLDYRTVGNNNPNKLTFQGMEFISHGRTCVHEVGHYLGLRHIWGDGGGIFGGSSCGADDGMEDTPNQGEQTGFSCDKTRNTCTDPSNDLPDMVENYMDYSDEACQNTFTKDQVNHMRKVLENQRIGLMNGQVSTSIVHTDHPIKIFPNPNQGSFQVSNAPESETFTFSIFDALGRLIISGEVLGGETQNIQLQNIPGFYGFKAINSIGQTFSKTIILW